MRAPLFYLSHRVSLPSYANSHCKAEASATQGILQCTAFDDGCLLWQQETPDWKCDRQLTVANGLLFAVTTHDEPVLAEASRTGYRELGRFDPKVKMGLPQQPIIANGHLYLRGDETLACFALVVQGSLHEFP